MEDEVLVHHGIKGQKWGIRRFQNADGSLTVAGRRRYGNGSSGLSGEAPSQRKGLSENQKETLKKIGKAALIAGSVAAVAYAASKNKDLCNVALNSIGNMAVDTLDKYTDVAKNGHRYVAEMVKEAKEGVKAGIAEAPKKVGEGIKEGISEGSKNISKSLTQAPSTVAKVALEGATIIAVKKMMEATIGKEQIDSTTQAYNAYHKKNKIGQLNQKKDDDDDD